MVRIRIEAETISLALRETIDRLSYDYGDGAVQTVSDQALRIDNVPVASVSAVLESLADIGFAPQGDREDSIRSVTSCVRAGTCPRERFDVTSYATAIAAYSRQTGSSKLKIAFSGCPSDCALASVADLGFVAQCQEGAKGFCVYAGGTPEPDPAIGMKIEEFVCADDIFEIVEAVTRLFNQCSNHAEGPALRLRGIIDRLGPVEFTRRYREQRAAITKTDRDCVVLKLATPT